MKVNHKDYAKFDYISHPSDTHQLGDVVINEHNEIGVIIQSHADFLDDFRTDMFGNCCLQEIRFATQKEIETFRSELLNNSLTSV